jgi:hypothetical protein
MRKYESFQAGVFFFAAQQLMEMEGQHDGQQLGIRQQHNDAIAFKDAKTREL